MKKLEEVHETQELLEYIMKQKRKTFLILYFLKVLVTQNFD